MEIGARRETDALRGDGIASAAAENAR